MPLNFPFQFDFKNPNYEQVIKWRTECLERLLKDPALIRSVIKYYRDNIAQFIIDWGFTYNPKKISDGKDPEMPFILLPKQEECVNRLINNWKNKKDFLIDKSREMGASWISVAVAASVCLFYPKVVIGFGSRKEMYVDKRNDPDCLLWKARAFINNLPAIFKFGWDEVKHSKHLQISFPHNGSIIKGEAGRGLGRGGRNSMFFVDESAWIEDAESLNASLASTTDCRVDISTPHGRNNSFAKRRFSGKIDHISLHWRDDPAKDDKWYQAYCDKLLNDSTIIAQELEINYDASVEGCVIPIAWVNSAIDAHLKLNVQPSGAKKAGLDVADEGKDLNAICGRYGILVQELESWSGKGDDIFSSVERAISFCDRYAYNSVVYDADGLGAGVKGDARIINEKRSEKVNFTPFRGGGEIIYPLREWVEGRKNQDFFANFKAQSWWALRMRFQKTHRAIAEGKAFEEDEIISISSNIKELSKLIIELSQPTFYQNNAGKILIDKAPEGARSPNLADAVMIAFSPVRERGLF